MAPNRARKLKAQNLAQAPAQTPTVMAGEDLLQALGRIKGLETDIAAVIQAMQQKMAQLECLMEFSSLMNSTLDTDVVREKALEATCRLLGCETASILLVNRATGTLYWESALGAAGKELKNSFTLPINDRSIAGYVAMTAEPQILNDVQADARHNKKATSKSGFVSRTMVCIPLKTKDRVVGVLQAINKLPSTLQTKRGRFEWPIFLGEDLKLLETLGHQVAIAIENSKLYSDLKLSFYDTVAALAEAIEKKDHYTGGHTKRVVYYSLLIAKYMNLTTEQMEQVRLGALLHDVGKIGIEDTILKKQAHLDVEEWRVMQKHPELGFEIMSKVSGLKDVLGGMRYHHERWDGKGYPLGLVQNEIPLLARIIAVADTYDAMVSTRPYRKGLPVQMAFDEILRYRETQFDPAVVDAFVQAYKNEKMGRGSGGSRHKAESTEIPFDPTGESY